MWVSGRWFKVRNSERGYGEDLLFLLPTDLHQQLPSSYPFYRRADGPKQDNTRIRDGQDLIVLLPIYQHQQSPSSQPFDFLAEKSRLEKCRGEIGRIRLSSSQLMNTKNYHLARHLISWLMDGSKGEMRRSHLSSSELIDTITYHQSSHLFGW